MPPGAGQPKATGRAALTHLRSRVGRELLFSGHVGAPQRGYQRALGAAAASSSGSPPGGPK